MYNHQLHYDEQLAMFLMEAKMALSDRWGEVWDTIHALADREGIMFESSLSQSEAFPPVGAESTIICYWRPI